MCKFVSVIVFGSSANRKKDACLSVAISVSTLGTANLTQVIDIKLTVTI